MFITTLYEWLSRSRIFLLTSALTVYGYASFSQNEFGYEVYDSVKVDLKNGLLVDRYLPFDVPFYMIGDADSLESIELSIIQADQHACCVDFLDPDTNETADHSCDYPCESKAEQKLRFYKTVRKIQYERLSSRNDRGQSPVSDALRNIRSALTNVLRILREDTFSGSIDRINPRQERIDSVLWQRIIVLPLLLDPWIYEAERLEGRVLSDPPGNRDIGSLLGILHGSYVIISEIENGLSELLHLNISNTSRDNNARLSIEELAREFGTKRKMLKTARDSIRVNLKGQTYIGFGEKDSIPWFNLADSIEIIGGQIEVLEAQQSILNGEVNYIRQQLLDSVKKDPTTVLYHHKVYAKIDDTIRSRFNAINSIYHPIDTLLQSLKILHQSLTREKAFQNEFYRKYEDRWPSYVSEMSDQIERNRSLICEDCAFNPNRCNYICGWKANPVLASDKFVLSIPPLRANKSYRFFFTISRRSNNAENEKIKKVLAQNMLIRIDSVFEGLIDIHTRMASNIQEVRSDLLNTSKYIDADLEIINRKIVWYLKDEYGDIDIKVTDLAFNDVEAARKLLNRLISHKYYHLGLDTIHRYHLERKSPKKDPAWRAIIESTFTKHLNQKPERSDKFITHRYTYEDRKLTFFKAERMDEFFLLDTLNLIERTNSLLRQPPDADVPSGLLPYANLQSVNLRKLETIRDFDPKTADQYLNNLESYKAYLKKVQSFILDTLIRKNPDQLRLRLFVAHRYPNDPSVTPRERTLVDAAIVKELHAFADAIFKHEINVREALNVYWEYQANLDSLNKQVYKVVDSVLNNNRKVQLAVLKNIGGITSANFQTRTEWYVSADVGVAHIPFGVGAFVPYFGANFNIAPINRHAHYSLFGRKRPKNSKTSYLWENPTKLYRFYKALSLVVGVTTTDLSEPNERENLIGDNTNVMIGAGLRITEAARVSTGAFLTKRIDENPTINNENVGVYWWWSLSFDIDVVDALGDIKNFIFPKK